MTATEVLTTVRYVTDAKGQPTDVLIPVPAWQALLVSWKQLVERLEDREDVALLQKWLDNRSSGTIEMIPLETMEQELIADGLLSR